MVPLWGATRALPEFLRYANSNVQGSAEQAGARSFSIGLITGRAEAHLEKAFDHIACSESPQFPRALEVLLLPGVMTAICVHAPIGSNNGLPVPLGLASFDPAVVDRTERYLEGRLRPFLKDPVIDALAARALQASQRQELAADSRERTEIA